MDHLAKWGIPYPASDTLYVGKEENCDSIKQYVNAGGDINFCSKKGVPPINIACYRWQKSVVNELLNLGAYVSFQTDELPPPIFVAINNKDSDLVERLLQSGAKLDDSWGGRTAMEYAQKIGFDISHLIFSHKEDAMNND